MKLDGDEVAVGDKVYDLSRGIGSVVEIRDTGFMVRFANKIMLVSDQGVITRRSIRTVYWHNPIIVTPAKKEYHWAEQQRALRLWTDFVKSMPPCQ